MFFEWTEHRDEIFLRCACVGCEKIGKFRCSRCKVAHYAAECGICHDELLRGICDSTRHEFDTFATKWHDQWIQTQHLKTQTKKRDAQACREKDWLYFYSKGWECDQILDLAGEVLESTLSPSERFELVFARGKPERVLKLNWFARKIGISQDSFCRLLSETEDGLDEFEAKFDQSWPCLEEEWVRTQQACREKDWLYLYSKGWECDQILDMTAHTLAEPLTHSEEFELMFAEDPAIMAKLTWFARKVGLPQSRLHSLVVDSADDELEKLMRKFDQIWPSLEEAYYR